MPKTIIGLEVVIITKKICFSSSSKSCTRIYFVGHLSHCIPGKKTDLF